MGNPFGDSYALLRRCPDLAKAILTAGLLVATLSTGGPLVLAEIKSDVWGTHMSAYSARLYMATGVVSMLFGGAFGRLTDRMERRMGFAIVGLLNFMPWYCILILGANEHGLYGYCVSLLFSGITCMTPTGCPMIFAFANDVIPAADREVAFGIAYTGAMIIALICSLIGVAVARMFPGEAVPVLAYIVFLSISFFITLTTIKLRVKEPEIPDLDLVFCGAGDFSDLEDSDNSDLDGNVPRIVGSTDPKLAAYGKSIDLEEDNDGGASTDSEFGHKRAPILSLIAPLRFAVEYAPLRYLCLTTALLCLPEVALGDVTNQFIYAELGILEGGKEQNGRKQLASMLNTYPGLLGALPAYFILGHLSKSVGALRLLKWLIPVAALLQVVPMAMVVCDYMWFVPVMGIALSLSGVIFTPLQIVNAQIAPEGRVGEAMAGTGVAKQCASVAANLVVTSVTPALRDANIDRPLRYYFPAAGVICLFAYIFAALIRLPDGSDGEEGPQSRSGGISCEADEDTLS